MQVSALNRNVLNHGRDNGEGNVVVYVCKVTAAIYHDYSITLAITTRFNFSLISAAFGTSTSIAVHRLEVAA